MRRALILEAITFLLLLAAIVGGSFLFHAQNARVAHQARENCLAVHRIVHVFTEYFATRIQDKTGPDAAERIAREKFLAERLRDADCLRSTR